MLTLFYRTCASLQHNNKEESTVTLHKYSPPPWIIPRFVVLQSDTWLLLWLNPSLPGHWFLVDGFLLAASYLCHNLFMFNNGLNYALMAFLMVTGSIRTIVRGYTPLKGQYLCNHNFTLFYFIFLRDIFCQSLTHNPKQSNSGSCL